MVAAVSDVIPLPLLLVLSLIAAGLLGAAWYWFPAWVPRRLPRLRRPRWRLRRPRPRLPRWRRPRLPRLRWRRPRLPRLRWPHLRWKRRRGDSAPPPPPVPADELPAVPADDLASLADRLAAAGRYAEAVRERLRAMVRHLVERGVIEHRPGWTVTELARAAGHALPAVGAPLSEAAALFSEVWYAGRPAGAETDARMRALADAAREALARSTAGSRG
nr:DUF4129 domain-containing protein [Planosporangium thailandense]